MKKNKIYLGLLMLFSIVITSCDEDKTTYNALEFPQDKFVSLIKSSLILPEASVTPIDVVVNLSNTESDETITVDFEITSDNAVLGTHYSIVDDKKSISFAPGVYQDIIQIMPIDNTEEDGDKNLVISLTSSPNVSLGFPGPDGNGKVLNLTIQDNDCAYTLEELAAAVWAGQDDAPANQAGPNDSKISMTYDGTNLLIEGIGYGWITDSAYWDESVITSTPVIAQIDPVTGDITIDKQPLCITTWKGDVQPDYFVEATGNYASCNKTMTLNYNIIQKDAILRSFEEVISF